MPCKGFFLCALDNTPKKAELKAIADRYEMGIIRQEITGSGVGLYLVTEKDIPELDKSKKSKMEK